MLHLYRPELCDLWFRQTMMADEETMSYNHAWGGVIPFPQERWVDWYHHWVEYPEEKRFYRYVKNEDGQFVGEIAYHYDTELNACVANVIIYSKYRGKGYGGQALDMLCAQAGEHGLSVLYDDIAIDNPALGMFLKHGFVEECRTGQKIYLKKQL